MVIWTISSLIKDPSNGGVRRVRWKALKEGANNSIEIGGHLDLTPNPTDSNFIEYNDRTEEMVLGWIWAEVDKDEIETEVEAQLDDYSPPLEGETGVIPWG